MARTLQGSASLQKHLTGGLETSAAHRLHRWKPVAHPQCHKTANEWSESLLNIKQVQRVGSH